MRRISQVLLGPPHLTKPTCRYLDCSIQILELCPTPRWDPLVYPLANADQRKELQQLRIVPIEAEFEVHYTVIFVQENFTSTSRIQWQCYGGILTNPTQMIKVILTCYIYEHERLE